MFPGQYQYGGNAGPLLGAYFGFPQPPLQPTLQLPLQGAGGQVFYPQPPPVFIPAALPLGGMAGGAPSLLFPLPQPVAPPSLEQLELLEQRVYGSGPGPGGPGGGGGGGGGGSSSSNTGGGFFGSNGSFTSTLGVPLQATRDEDEQGPLDGRDVEEEEGGGGGQRPGLPAQPGGAAPSASGGCWRCSVPAPSQPHAPAQPRGHVQL